jgi:hypothetical protein
MKTKRNLLFALSGSIVFANIVLALTNTLSSVAAPSETAQIKAAKSFQVEGVKLGMTKDEFYGLFPNATDLDDLTEISSGTVGVRVSETPNTDGIDAAFWKGRLLEYYVRYSPERVESMGSWHTIARRIVARLGKADAVSPGATHEKGVIFEATWKIDRADFCLIFTVKPERALLNVVDTEAHTMRGKEKGAKANTGF